MANYKVAFTFYDSYAPKTVGFLAISLVVSAHSSICAIADAREKLQSLELGEAKTVNVDKVSSDY